MRQPGIEPGSTAWKAAMLTTIPLTLTDVWNRIGGDFGVYNDGLDSKNVTAVTRIRTWVTAATTQGPNH